MTPLSNVEEKKQLIIKHGSQNILPRLLPSLLVVNYVLYIQYIYTYVCIRLLKEASQHIKYYSRPLGTT